MPNVVSKMKNKKSAGQDRVLAEVWKLESLGLRWLKVFFNKILVNSRSTKEKFCDTPIFEGK